MYLGAIDGLFEQPMEPTLMSFSRESSEALVRGHACHLCLIP
jgi:hypothetical protein